MKTRSAIRMKSSVIALTFTLAFSLPGHPLSAKDEEASTLEFSVRTESADRFTDEMMEYARKSGGYLVALRSGYMELRLPARLGPEAVEQRISAVSGTNVYGASRATEDVSGELVDLRARLKVAENNLAKLRELSDEAGMDDLLDLEKALNRSLQEVEEIKGKIRYLKESASLYSVKIRINSNTGSSDPDKVRIPRVRGLTLNGIMGGLE